MSNHTVLISASPNAGKAHHARSTAFSTIYRKTVGSKSADSKSTDNVWHEVRNGLPDPQGVVAPVLATNPHEPHTFYTLTNKGLYRSGDAGLTWEALLPKWPADYLTQHQQDLAVVSSDQ